MRDKPAKDNMFAIKPWSLSREDDQSKRRKGEGTSAVVMKN
jgi:hypothetical protein